MDTIAKADMAADEVAGGPYSYGDWRLEDYTGQVRSVEPVLWVDDISFNLDEVCPFDGPFFTTWESFDSWLEKTDATVLAGRYAADIAEFISAEFGGDVTGYEVELQLCFYVDDYEDGERITDSGSLLAGAHVFDADELARACLPHAARLSPVRDVREGISWESSWQPSYVRHPASSRVWAPVIQKSSDGSFCVWATSPFSADGEGRLAKEAAPWPSVSISESGYDRYEDEDAARAGALALLQDVFSEVPSLGLERHSGSLYAPEREDGDGR